MVTARRKVWAPERQDIIWIDCNPQVGAEMKDIHPILVLSAKEFNAHTGIVIGLPMSSETFNESNPFAVDNSRSKRDRSFILCHQPKSFDWRRRGAAPHPWGRVKADVFERACLTLNQIVAIA